MEKDVYLKDLNEPVRNYALFADLNAGQTFHIRSPDKTSHYYHYLCLNCCLHTAESDGELFIVICRCFLVFFFLMCCQSEHKEKVATKPPFVCLYMVEMYLVV